MSGWPSDHLRVREPGGRGDVVTACIRGCVKVRTYDDGTTARIPALTTEPALICEACKKRLNGYLTDFPVVYALLPAVLEPGSVERDPDAIASKRVDAPIPIRAEVVDLSDERRAGRGDEARGVLGVVEGWARVVREERDLAQPVERATVVSECALLVTHLDWIAEQPWVDECYDEIRAEHRTLTNAIGDYRVRPVGRCPVVHETGECGGALMPTMLGEVFCMSCHARWERPELRRLGLIIAS